MTIPQMEQAVERFYSDILRYMVSRIREHTTAEDLTQETFFRFIRYAGELTFPSEKKCKAYLFQIAANVCRDYFAGREVTVELEETIAAPEDDRDLALTLECDEPYFSDHVNFQPRDVIPAEATSGGLTLFGTASGNTVYTGIRDDNFLQTELANTAKLAFASTDSGEIPVYLWQLGMSYEGDWTLYFPAE